MLNFGSNHDTIIGNKPQNKLYYGKVAISGLLASISLWLTGCAQVVNCNVEKVHAHLFESTSSFDVYIASEKEYMLTLEGDYYYRTDEYVLIDEEEKEIIDFVKRRGLFRISDNKDVIDELVSYQNDFMLYEYEYTERRAIRYGKAVMFKDEVKTSLTNDPNKENLTGNTKIGHYVYWGYKIVRDEKGKLKLVKSEYVNSLDELPPEYIYVEKTFYKVVDLESFKDIYYVNDLKQDKTIEDIKMPKSNKTHKGRIKRR